MIACNCAATFCVVDLSCCCLISCWSMRSGGAVGAPWRRPNERQHNTNPIFKTSAAIRMRLQIYDASRQNSRKKTKATTEILEYRPVKASETRRFLLFLGRPGDLPLASNSLKPHLHCLVLPLTKKSQ